MADTTTQQAPATPEVKPTESTPVIASTSEGTNVVSNSKGLSSIFDRMEKNVQEGRPAVQDLKKEEPPAEKPKTAEAPPVEQKVEKVEEAPKKDEAKKPSAKDNLNKLLEESSSAPVQPQNDDGDQVTEDDLRVQPHDKPKTAKRIQAFLKKLDAVNRSVEEERISKQGLESKNKELQAELEKIKKSDPRAHEAIKAEMEELSMLRRQYQLDKDPAVKEKFDTRIQSSEDSITSILKANKAGQELLDNIKSEGGFLKFSKSNRMTSIPDGEGGTTQVTCAKLADMILTNALNLGDRNSIQSALLEQESLAREKVRFFEEQKSAATKFFKEREESEAKSKQQQQEAINSNLKAIEEWKAKFLAEDFIKDKVAAESATADEKSQISGHNKYNSELRSIMEKALSANGIQDILEVVGDSVKYHDEKRTSFALKRENDRLRAELDKIKSASRSTPRQGSIAAPVSQAQVQERPKTLAERLDAMISKKLSDGNDE